jgi:phosphatidylinositol alpha-1,6-mannosyltransferase
VKAAGSSPAGGDRVFCVTLDFPPRVGGIQIMVHRLALSFPSLRPLVVAPVSPGDADFDASLPVPVVRVWPEPSGSRVWKLLCLLSMFGRTLFEARRLRPRVLLCSHVVVAPIARAVRWCFGAPFAVYVHAYELIHLKGILAHSLRAADAVIADSHYSKELAIRLGVPGDRVAVIGQGADADVEPAASGHLERPGARRLILCVARMEELYKGQDVLIRSLPIVAARVPDVRLVLVGEGPFRDYFQRLTESMGVSDRVLFTGRVSDAERDRWFRECDVFAMLSRVSALDGAGEGFGVAYVEAAAHGKPVVAGRAGGSVDAVLDGVTGLLPDPQSVPEVADALVTVLTDRELARRLGEAGRQRVATDLSWREIGRRVEVVLRSAVARTETARR